MNLFGTGCGTEYVRSNFKKPPSGVLIGSDTALDDAETAGVDTYRPQKDPIPNSTRSKSPTSAGKQDVDSAYIEDQCDRIASSSEYSTTEQTPKKPFPKRDSSTASPHQGFCDEGFHIFVWLNQGVEDKKKAVECVKADNNGLPGSVKHSVIRDLDEIDQFLSRKTNLADRLSYQACPQLARQEVYDMLIADRKKVTDIAEIRVRENYETKVNLVNAAELIFRFFLPSRFDGPTVRRYWGALGYILQVGK